MQQLLGLQHRFTAPTGTTDLSKLTLNQFIASGPAVVIIFDDTTLSPGAFSHEGFAGSYNNSQLSV
jgi:hypothetical protein